ncbi:SOS response-associated peptidase [Actinobaculum massiliense]
MASSPLGMAGLYAWWKDPAGQWLLSATIMTRAAEGAMRAIHHREPVVLDPEEYGAWLDPSQQDAQRALALISRPAPRLEAVSVTTRVGNVANNSPANVRPLQMDQ